MRRQQADPNKRSLRLLALPLAPRKSSIGAGSVQLFHSVSVMGFALTRRRGLSPTMITPRPFASERSRLASSARRTECSRTRPGRDRLGPARRRGYSCSVDVLAHELAGKHGHTPEPADDRPWERPGAVRRDCKPHRGRLLVVLVTASELFSVLSILFPTAYFGFPFWAFAIQSLIGPLLGALSWAVVRHDLGQMEAGLIDPGGREQLRLARGFAIAGVALGLLPWVLCGCSYLL
jgi:hypothetical protein